MTGGSDTCSETRFAVPFVKKIIKEVIFSQKIVLVLLRLTAIEKQQPRKQTNKTSSLFKRTGQISER